MPASDISAFRATETEYILVADKLPYGELVQSVRIGLWNEGISDLRWYEAPQQSDGRWMAVMSVKDYGKSGTYGGDVYAVLKNGQNVKVGSLS
ncbi:GBS Bsp-like repeat-containing protein, partial [Acinetobacter baumannii]|nr:GBS Bsp-like repeat-containing protein [Acinetobacter baumannii]